MIKFGETFSRLALICAAGIILNVLGVIVVKELELPIYFDTIGTIFIAALGGYVPGIAVGFFTNLLGALFDEEEIYYGMVSVLIAVLTAFLARRGYYEKFPKVLWVIPATVLLTSFNSTLIEEMLSLTNSFGYMDFLPKICSHFLEHFSAELPDKSSAVLLSFFALKFIPPEVKKNFKLLGKMQAPVSPEMHRAINTNSKLISSLRTKLLFNLMAITLFVAFFISAISYKIYQDSIIDDRKRIADGIISMVVAEIDPKRVDEFLDKGYQADGYIEVERELHKIRVSNSDIKFIYVYKIMEDGCHVVFDLDTPTVEASEPGSIEDFDETFIPLLPDLLAGKPIKPITNNDKYGYLLTIYKPVYDSMGHCVCYAGIDFSMEILHDYGRMFIAKVIALFSGAVILIFVLVLTFVENNIILPVNTMAYCARNFAYDSEAAREKNIQLMKSLEIRTHDEIENLYSAFLKTTSDSMHYFENLKRSKIQLAVMDELAHKDALTGLKNKTAYAEYTAKLDADIFKERAEFAIIMIDVNFLKRVNDTYGHEYGNTYLINAGKLAASVFGADKVYRIGGDEFVVVLSGKELARCEELVAELRGMIEKLQADENLQPWEKVSAAVGVAYFDERFDETAEDVFKRADKDMYKNKLAMKATRRD
ncbi:MAG: diguanylate cyclase [Selenomonadaceae bacterium]|nr:diguanylate cyclase [Selenomonadaceae bacterium]MBQ9496099.1 diguanylate cyclase [Selenomonadaceae bacterium]